MSDKALDSFIGAIGEMRDRLDELTAYANDHMGYNPDDIDWSHVGTANHMLEKLTELTDLAYGRGEHARHGATAAYDRRPIVGAVSFASGETFRYTDPDAYIAEVKKELPYRNVSGFKFLTLTSNPRVRKAIDDLIHNEYGEENPRGQESYSQPRQSDDDADEAEYGVGGDEDDEDDWEPEM